MGQLTLSALTGDWKIWQRSEGHRFSTDDLLTAYFASRLLHAPSEILDLGCGIGSVLLMLAWRFPEARLIGIEAQPQSLELARRSIDYNDVGDRVYVRPGDLRDPDILGRAERFDLITGTPPYFPPGTGRMPRDPQQAYARFELRGGVEAYCQMAARALASGGRFAFVFPAGQEERALKAGRDAGLAPIRVWRVFPKEGKDPLVLLAGFALADERDPHALPDVDPPLCIRDAEGRRSQAMIDIRVAMGMPAGKPRPGSLY